MKLGGTMGQPNVDRAKPKMVEWWKSHVYPEFYEQFTRADFEAWFHDEGRDGMFEIAKAFRLKVSRRTSTRRLIDRLVATARERLASW